MPYSDDFKKFAVEYYYACSSCRKAAKDLGVSPASLVTWVKADGRAGLKMARSSGPEERARKYPEDTIRLALGLAYGWPQWRLKEASRSLGVPMSTINAWKERYILRGTMDVPVLYRNEIPAKRPWSLEQEDRDIAELEAEIASLRLKNDVLQETIQALKGEGVDCPTGMEKSEVIDALRRKRPLKALLEALDIPSSSYCCDRARRLRPDKHSKAREAIKEEFWLVNSRRGYRHVHQRLRLRKDVAAISEKVVRRIMAEEGLSVPYAKKRRRRSSYVGGVSEAPENLAHRRFHSSRPNELWLTDITDFKIRAEKVYLSPIIDCFDGAVVSWSIGVRPTAELANESLEKACRTLHKGQRPLCHSDRGGHCRWPGWLRICEENEIVRSMSRKGCSPDNSAMEGFFGRLKNEFFYYRDWDGTSREEFIRMLDDYMVYYNAERPKASLGWLSPMEFRRAVGWA